MCCKNAKSPDLFRSGMDCFRGILRGSHLPAHTWANRPMLQGVFSSAGIKTPPFMVNLGCYIMREGEKSRENIAEHYKMNDGVSVQLAPVK